MVNKKLKEVFTVTINDQEVKVAVKRPTMKDNAEARKEFNRAFNEALASKAIIRGKVDRVLREQELWDDNTQKEFETLGKAVQEAREKLKDDKINVEEGTALAETCKANEKRLRELRAIRSSIDVNTAEAQAENAMFNRLVSLCTVYDNNEKPVFSSYEDFINRGDEAVALKAAETMMYLTYNIDPNYEENLPENKFLAKIGKQEEVGEVKDQTTSPPQPSPAD